MSQEELHGSVPPTCEQTVGEKKRETNLTREGSMVSMSPREGLKEVRERGFRGRPTSEGRVGGISKSEMDPVKEGVTDGGTLRGIRRTSGVSTCVRPPPRRRDRPHVGGLRLRVTADRPRVLVEGTKVERVRQSWTATLRDPVRDRTPEERGRNGTQRRPFGPGRGPSHPRLHTSHPHVPVPNGPGPVGPWTVTYSRRGNRTTVPPVLPPSSPTD